MTKLQAIAKMLFAVMGVYFFKGGLNFISYSPVNGAHSKVFLSFGILCSFFNLFVAYFLIFKSDRLAVELGRGGEEADYRWVVNLFTAAAIFAGGLLLAGCIRKSYVLGDLFKVIAILPADIGRLVSSGEIPTLITIDPGKKIQIIAWFAKTAIAMFVMFGMKKFIRWQVYTLKRWNLAIKAD